MPVTVGVVVNVDALEGLLGALAGKLKSLRPVFAQIDADVSRLLREQFATRGAALGTPWAPISGATIRLRTEKRILSKRGRKTAMGAAGADTPLRDSGELWASFTKPTGPWSLRVFEALSYQRGSRYAPGGVPVAVLMQEGFKSTHRPIFTKAGVFFKKRDTPLHVAPRPILPATMPAPVLKAWEGYVTQYLTGDPA